MLVLSHSYAWLGRTIRAWAAQNVHDRIEAIVVKPESVTLSDEELSGLAAFHQVEVVDVPRLESVAMAFATAVRRARAPVVMLAEDHAFPEPGLAEAVLAAYADPDVLAVGTVLVNANPETVASEASFVASFSHAAYAESDRGARMLAGHNASYRRDFLASQGDELADLYGSERVMQYAIEAAGKRIVLLARPRMHHVNADRWGPVLSHAFLGGRVLAAKRRRAWGLPRRLLHAAGSPLVPLVRGLRILADLRESPPEYDRIVPGRLPAVAAVLTAHALGELTGYLFGPGDAEARYSRFELYRRRQLSPRGRREMDRVEG